MFDMGRVGEITILYWIFIIRSIIQINMNIFLTYKYTQYLHLQYSYLILYLNNIREQKMG